MIIFFNDYNNNDDVIIIKYFIIILIKYLFIHYMPVKLYIVITNFTYLLMLFNVNTEILKFFQIVLAT